MAVIESDEFVKALTDIGFDFFTGVPDVILAGVLDVLREQRVFIPAVRAEEALAMAAGAYLGGKVPAVLLDQSGLGACVSALTSLSLIYQLPCLLLVAWPGAGGGEAPEHRVLGQTLPALLETLRLPHRTLSQQSAVEDLRWTAETFMKQRVPVALLIKKGVVKGLQP